MDSITFVKATINDWKKVSEIEKSATSTLYFPLDTEKEVIEYIQGYTVYIIMHDNETIGTIAYKIEADDKVHVDGLIVIPEYRGKGIAKRAIHKIVSEFENKVYSLTVHPSNAIAIRLYLGLGFVITAWKDNYFGDGQPRLIMEK